MKHLLFITQKLHGQDAFGVLWAKAFMKRGYRVTVLCLEYRPEELSKVLEQDPLPFEVYSMGKEHTSSKVRQIFTFIRLISTLKYDSVFIHMAPVWMTLGWWVWLIRNKPVYLWYTHYKMQLGVKLVMLFGKRAFCATPQSLPQYPGHPKKIVTGHGIDLSFWPQRENKATDPMHLLGVFRLSRSKRVEICIRALSLLPGYRFDIYGIRAELDYADELETLIKELHLEDRVKIHPSVPAKDLPALYVQHRLILNMASETIDKTMLEAMTCGCYPVTTAANAAAIGIPSAPSEDTPEAVAMFIKAHAHKAPIDADEMYRVVEEGHSLDALIEKMDVYIAKGN